MNAPLHQHHLVEPDQQPAAGYRLAQLALATVFAHKERSRADVVARTLFADDNIALAVARAAASVADTTTAGWAAELMRADAVALLQTLVPVSVWARLASQGVPLAFNGSQSVRVVSLPLPSPSAGPAWVGEGGVLPVIKTTAAGQRIAACKLGGVIAISKELDRSSAGVAAMQQLLRAAAASMLDRSLLDAAAAVPGVRPAGLLNGVTLGAGSPAGGLAAMAADVATLIGAMQGAGAGINPVFIVNSATAAAVGVLSNGTFGGQQVVGSPMVASDVVVCVDQTCFASAFDAPSFDASEQATVTMANADGVAPTQAGAAPGGGAIGTAGRVVPDGGIPIIGGSGASIAAYQAASMLQLWSVALRLVWPAGYAVTMPGAVQGLNGITWASAPAAP